MDVEVRLGLCLEEVVGVRQGSCEDLREPGVSLGRGTWGGDRRFPQIPERKDQFTEDQAGPGGETELVEWKELSHSPAAQPLWKLVSNLPQRVCQWDWKCCLVSLGSSQLRGHRHVIS